jgi:hypothetical protein
LDISNWVEVAPFAEWEALDFLIGDGALRAEPARLLYRQLAQALGPKVGNPQVLTMARRLWREGARIPKTLSGLFMAFFQVAGAALAPELREGLLPRLAMFMSREDRISIQRHHLEHDAKGQTDGDLHYGLGFQEVTGVNAEELLTELGKTRLLRGPTAFSFPSIGFQEFLTAVALRWYSTDEVADMIPPAEWEPAPSNGLRPYNLHRSALHGAVPLLCGLLDYGSTLILRLIERDVLLAAECCREAGTETAVDESLRVAIQGYMRSADPLLQCVGCLALEARGDSWSVGVLERVAANVSSPARPQALEALGELRSRRSIPLLKAAVLEKDPVIARAALDALGRIKIASNE